MSFQLAEPATMHFSHKTNAELTPRLGHVARLRGEEDKILTSSRPKLNNNSIVENHMRRPSSPCSAAWSVGVVTYDSGLCQCKVPSNVPKIDLL